MILLLLPRELDALCSRRSDARCRRALRRAAFERRRCLRACAMMPRDAPRLRGDTRCLRYYAAVLFLVMMRERRYRHHDDALLML